MYKGDPNTIVVRDGDGNYVDSSISYLGFINDIDNFISSQMLIVSPILIIIMYPLLVFSFKNIFFIV